MLWLPTVIDSMPEEPSEVSIRPLSVQSSSARLTTADLKVILVAYSHRLFGAIDDDHILLHDAVISENDGAAHRQHSAARMEDRPCASAVSSV